MKTWIAAATGIALLAGGVAVAQTAAAPPPPPPPGTQAGPGGPGGPGAPPPGGPEDWHRGPPPFMGHGPMMGMHHGMRPLPPTKAAVFHFRRGDARIDIKCADDEPTKACVDAAGALMDKLAAQPNPPR